MSVNVVILELQNAVNAALTEKNQAQSAYDAIMVDVRELQRQAEYHRQRGDNTNLQIVNGQLSAKYLDKDAALSVLNDKTDKYNKALKALADAQNALLSPEEKQAKLAAEQASAAQTVIAAKADADSKLFAQKTTKYLIIGAIVLVIIVAGIYVYRKKFM